MTDAPTAEIILEAKFATKRPHIKYLPQIPDWKLSYIDSQSSKHTDWILDELDQADRVRAHAWSRELSAESWMWNDLSEFWMNQISQNIFS